MTTRSRGWMWILGAVAGAALLAACPEKKTDGGGGGGTSSSASATTSVAATASATTSASASVAAKDDDDDDDIAGVPSTSASATASAKPSATAATTGKPTTTAVASATAFAPGSCGGKDQPKCPLQAWMASNMQPAMQSGDGKKISAALRASAKLQPPGYGDWAKIATDGAAAVDAAKDPDAVAAAAKAACKSCHGEYQKRYRTEMRERPI